VLRVLVHLAFIAGGRPLGQPPHARVLKLKGVRVSKRGRPLPVHADGDPVGVTPVSINVAAAALNVIVGSPGSAGVCAWDVVDA